MNPIFSKHVDDAEGIRTSGRWTAVNAAIERLAANPGADNAWYVQVIGGLCFKAFSEYWQLKNAYADSRAGDASLLAWRARNLLELAIWSTYCSKSRANARALFEDAGRDVHGLYGAFQKWGNATAQDSDWLKIFTSAKQDLFERAASEGIETLEGAYQRVERAAKDCGMEIHFLTVNKMLSKFAHPTAMQILAPPDDARDVMQRDCFFGMGCLYFIGAFNVLESQLN